VKRRYPKDDDVTFGGCLDVTSMLTALWLTVVGTIRYRGGDRRADR
jgi:hypothetical protein